MSRMPPAMTAPRMPLVLAVAVMTPPQSDASVSSEVSQTTTPSGLKSSSIWARNVISPSIMQLGALFTVKASPQRVISSRSGMMSLGRFWLRRVSSRMTSLMAPV